MTTRPADTNGIPWDGYEAYLFDIDGTLLQCTDAVHYFAFCDVLGTVAGRPLNLDGVTAHGNTDVGILRDALALAGVADERWRPGLAGMRSSLGDFVEARRDDLQVVEMPGARQVLQHLRSRGAVLGVATGNLERIGKLKLGRCGLLDCFDFGGYSDAHENRRDVFAAALQQALDLARGRGKADARVCVVGDTPEDIRAARANGLDVIAVAKGIYSFEELAAERPDWCLRSLEELLSGGGKRLEAH